MAKKLTKKVRHRHQGHPEWMLNDERDDRSIADFGKVLEKIGGRLAESGEVKISSHEISPPEYCWTTIRFERKPRGELSLKLELSWDPGEDQEPSATPDLEIE